MLFNSYKFLAFFVVVYVVYCLMRRGQRAQNGLLLVASYVFYAAWDYRFLSLIILSTFVDYVAAQRITASDHISRRRLWLSASVSVNLGMLATFKYLGFAAESFCELLGMFGLSLSQPFSEIVLPVGISFYTFQTLSYTIDVYRGRIAACRDPLAFAVYVAFFPQLVAGPIERATHFLPQVIRERTIHRSDLALGLQWILLGYFYKVVLADSMAPMVNQYYAEPEEFGGSMAWLINLGFAVQIYGDFAGYSLIARGISRAMGFRLISNFRQPWLAQSPREFWTRWHRSLSIWLRRYLYFELGGSRTTLQRTCRNLMITMLLGGLWHGASWNFVLWGGFHGLLLVMEHLWRARKNKSPSSTNDHAKPIAGIVRVVVMFVVMLVGWTLFRCESLDQISVILTQMFIAPTMDSRWFAFAYPIAMAFAIMLGMDLWKERARSQLVLVRASVPVRWTIYSAMGLAIFAVGFRQTTFLYFQF